MKISVITVCLNAASSIRTTVESVLSQTLQSVEYIIVDGGSSDETVPILEEYRSRIDYFVSESDRGLAHAMNKGAAAATGDFLVFLHSDDYFHDSESLRRAADEVLKYPGYDIYCFDILYGHQDQLRRKSSRGFSAWMNFKTCFWHQGVLMNKQVFDELGGFDESYSIAMDYELFLRAYRAKRTSFTHPFILTIMSDQGISSRYDPSTVRKRLLEERRSHYRNSASRILLGIYSIYWILYPPYKMFRCALHARSNE